jgi:hypothetical protein
MVNHMGVLRSIVTTIHGLFDDPFFRLLRLANCFLLHHFLRLSSLLRRNLLITHLLLRRVTGLSHHLLLLRWIAHLLLLLWIHARLPHHLLLSRLLGSKSIWLCLRCWDNIWAILHLLISITLSRSLVNRHSGLLVRRINLLDYKSLLFVYLRMLNNDSFLLKMSSATAHSAYDQEND